MTFRTLDANALKAFIASSSKQHLAKNITKSTQKAHALGSINFQFFFFLTLFIITLKKKNYFFIHFLVALSFFVCNSFLFSLSLSCNNQHRFGFNIFIFSLVILSLEMTRSLDCKWQWLDL